jgi:CheY-like chemotaxis protein
MHDRLAGQGLIPSDIASTSAAAPVGENPHRARGTILLVDDEHAILEVASRLLASAGLAVLLARDGEQALRLFVEHQQAIQLALVDLSMPRMNGEQIVRELRGRSPELPLVLMSGYPEADVMDRLREVHLAGYLQKPFRLPALLDLLRRLNLID